MKRSCVDSWRQSGHLTIPPVLFALASIVCAQDKAPEKAPEKATPSGSEAKPPPADGAVRWNELTAGTSKLRFYGFLRLDLYYNDSRPNNTQTIGYIRSEDPAAPASIGGAKVTGKVDYYFGNLDERRVTWSSGRDLALSPAQAGAPVNALPKAYVEVDGKLLPEGKADSPSGWMRKLTYREKKAS